MFKLATWLKGKDVWARIMQFAAFSVSCYLTMGMFSALVDGITKVWIFRSFGLIYETSKLSVLRKSFSVKRHRITLRIFALVLMAVSVSGAVLSAIKDTMAAEAEFVAGYSDSQEKLSELIAQRDAWQSKLNGLSPEYRTSSMEYGRQIQRLQEEIDRTRSESSASSVAIARKSGVFEEASRVIFNGSIPANLIRFFFFVVFIVLNEAVLYFETYFVSIENGEEQSLLERIKLWKIFHKKPTIELVREAVKEKVAELQSRPVAAGNVDTLF